MPRRKKPPILLREEKKRYKGYAKPYRILDEIRQVLEEGPSYSQAISTAVRNHIRELHSEDKSSKVASLKLPSREAILVYTYMLRRIGLIQYTGMEERAHHRTGLETDDLARAKYLKIVPGKEHDSAWDLPMTVGKSGGESLMSLAAGKAGLKVAKEKEVKEVIEVVEKAKEIVKPVKLVKPAKPKVKIVKIEKEQKEVKLNLAQTILDKWQKAKRNYELARTDLDKLKAVGYDVDSAQEALDEYNSAEPEDKNDRWDDFVEELANLVEPLV